MKITATKEVKIIKGSSGRSVAKEPLKLNSIDHGIEAIKIYIKVSGCRIRKKQISKPKGIASTNGCWK